MKAIKFTVFALMMLFTSSSFAQRDFSSMNNKELSTYFGQQIDEINAKIKLVKVQLKGDKNNADYQSELNRLNNDLKKMKDDKKIIDTAIKAEEKAQDAIENAEKMAKKAEEAKKKAEEMKKEAAEAARKALQVRG